MVLLIFMSRFCSFGGGGRLLPGYSAGKRGERLRNEGRVHVILLVVDLLGGLPIAFPPVAANSKRGRGRRAF